MWNYANYVLGYKGATHDIAHKRPPESGKWDNWRAKQHAYFLERMKNTPEGNSNMLDQTVVVWGSAHPHASHSNKNYPIQVAGGNALGFNHGRLHSFEGEEKYLWLIYSPQFSIQWMFQQRNLLTAQERFQN